MKLLVVFPVVLVAASAQLTLPYAYGLHAFGGKSAPCVNAANLPVPCAGAPLAYAGHPYAYGKRDADADAFVYPGYAHAAVGVVAHGYGIPNPVHAVAATPLGPVHSSHVGLCTNYLGAAVPCGGKKKREADADAYVPYHHGYAGHVLGLKSAPCVNAANHPVPCANVPYHHGYGYHAYGKRDADADAFVYPGYGHAAVVAHGYGYGISNPVHAVAATPAGPVHSSLVGLCTNYLGAAVPCRRKREADADADVVVAAGVAAPGLLGYGYGLGLGYHGVAAAPAVYASAPVVAAAAPVVAAAHHVVAPVATVTQAVIGTADLPNPVHGVAHTIYGAVHSSHVGVCTNYLGEQVSC